MNQGSSGPAARETSPADPDRGEVLRMHAQDRGDTPSVLAELIKADLRRRFADGDRPAVAEYLETFPALRDESDRVLSLLYEEYCLLEEVGEAPTPGSFCDRYAPWRDSLASQLNYHRMLSQAAGAVAGSPPRFPESGEYFLGRYRLRSLLGQGGAARVFLADDDDLGGRLNALKVSADRGDEPSIMGRLQHPHIMPVLNVARDPETGLRGLCMPYFPGRPLDQVLQRMANIPPSKRTARTLVEAAAPDDLAVKVGGPGWAGFPHRGTYADACSWFAAALADALGHAHEREILHRDVKPANVLVSAADGPQLLDFNLAHDPHAPERAESALRGGTLPYMAPEQLEAFRDPDRWEGVGPTADLYALGLVLRELLIGRRPEAPPADLPLPRAINDLLALRIDGWPPIRAVNPGVPHALEAIVARCLAPEPAGRYPSAAVLADDLRAFVRRRPLPFAANPSRSERARNWLRRHRAALLAATVAGILPLAGAANRERLSIWAVDAAGYKFTQAKAPSHQSKRDLRLSRSTALFMLALRLNPENERAIFGLGLIAREEGRHDDSSRLIDLSWTLARSRIDRAGGGRADDPVSRDVAAFLGQVELHRANVEVGAANRLDPTSPEYESRIDAALPYLESALDVLPFCETLGRFRILTMYARVVAEIAMRRYERGDGDLDELRARLGEALHCLESALAEDGDGIELSQRHMARILHEDVRSFLEENGGATSG